MERPIDDPDGSASFCWREPAGSQTTPSQRLIKGEKALRLAAMLESLPEAQREAVRLRHLEGWPLERIAEALDRSVVATAGLIKRGLKRLRQQMSPDSWS
jgi:RNA polymerase sigma-70 factor (ECF subfamily)